MGLSNIQSYPAISTGVIDQGSTQDQTSVSSSFVSLSDTVSLLPSGGSYLVSISGGTVGFGTPEADKISFNDSGTNVSGSDTQTFLKNLDAQVEANKNNIGGGGDPTNSTTVAAAGAVMNSDFGTNGVMRRTGSDSYDVVTNGIDDLASNEVDQLKNIGSNTIDSTNWGVVSGLDQGLSTSDDVAFSSVNNLSLSEQSSSFQVAGGSGTTRTLTVDDDAAVTDFMKNLSDDASPTAGGDINMDGNEFTDSNSKTLVGLSQSSNAVNYLELSNADSTNSPTIKARGSDTNIDYAIESKGSGGFSFNGTTISQNQWNTFLANMDQDVSTNQDVTFNSANFTDAATTKQNLSLDNVPNEDATDPYNLDQKGASDGDRLAWNSANGRYEPSAPASGGSAIELDLNDDGTAQSSDLNEIATTNDSNSIFGNPTGDKLLIDASKNWPEADNVPDSAVDHNNTTNYNSNEHIDHTSVSINSGSGISGGGDLTASRTINLDANTSNLNDMSTSTPSAGQIPIYHGTNSQYENSTLTGGSGVNITNGDASVTLDVDEANVDHNSLQNYTSNEHIDHSGVSVSGGEGVSGGGDLTSSRTLALDVTGLPVEGSVGDTDELLFYDSSASSHKKIVKEDIEWSHRQVGYTIYRVSSGQPIPSDADWISCDTSSSSYTLTFQSPGTYGQNAIIAISDKSGNASTNPVEIQNEAGETIAGLDNKNNILYFRDTGTTIEKL